MRARAILVAGLALGPSVPASAQDLKPAPDYYLEAVVAFTAAEALARSCGSVSLDAQVMQARSAEVLSRLDREGFDTTREDAGMIVPTEELNARLTAMMERHGLGAGASEEEVCAAARAEMADESGSVGRFLRELG